MHRPYAYCSPQCLFVGPFIPIELLSLFGLGDWASMHMFCPSHYYWSSTTLFWFHCICCIFVFLCDSKYSISTPSRILYVIQSLVWPRSLPCYIYCVIASHMPIPVACLLACLLSLFHPCLPLLHMCYHCFSPVPTSLLPTITDSLVCRLLLIYFMPIIIISHFPYIFTVIDLHLCPFLLYVYCRMINELMWFTLMIKILAQVFKRSLDFLSTKREEHVFLLWSVLLAFPFFSFWDLPYFVP